MLLRSYHGSIAGVAELDDYAATIDGLPGGPPLAQWRLGEAGGSQIVDRKGSSPGTYSGMIGYAAAGLPQNSDGAVDFAGTGYGEIPHDAGLALSAFTLSFWFKLNRMPTTEEDRFALISKDLPGFNAGDLTVWVEADGDIVAQHQSGSSAFPITLTVPIVAGTAYHVAVRSDGTGYDLTVNGQKSPKETGFLGAWTSNAQPLRFGTVPWLVSEAGTWPQDAILLDGILDEIALYDYIVSDAGILSLAQYDQPPIASNDSFTVPRLASTTLDVVNNDQYAGEKADLTVEVFNAPNWTNTVATAFGTATVDANNNIVFEAGEVAQTEQDSITYRITDAFGTSGPATVSLTIQHTVVGSGSGDGFGGTLIYDFSPLASWIDGVPLDDRDVYANVQADQQRWIDGDAFGGANFYGTTAGANSGDAVCCWNRAPTGHPSLEIYSRQGHNPGGFRMNLNCFPYPGLNTNPRHLRVVAEIRLCAPSDPITFINQGLGSSNWQNGFPRWHHSTIRGGKYFIGVQNGGSASASCRTNWCGDSDSVRNGAAWRIGWGRGGINGVPDEYNTDSQRRLTALDISWVRPTACEWADHEAGLPIEFTELRDIEGEWCRHEIELKLASPSSVPAGAVAGGGCSHSADGFLRQWLTRDIDNEKGGAATLSGVRTRYVNRTSRVTFPRNNNYHQVIGLNGPYFSLWFGGTGGTSVCQTPVISWIRRIECYHYPEDDV